MDKQIYTVRERDYLMRVWNVYIFWIGVGLSFGLVFLLAYLFERIKPTELIQYVHSQLDQEGNN